MKGKQIISLILLISFLISMSPVMALQSDSGETEDISQSEQTEAGGNQINEDEQRQDAKEDSEETASPGEQTEENNDEISEGESEDDSQLGEETLPALPEPGEDEPEEPEAETLELLNIETANGIMTWDDLIAAVQSAQDEDDIIIGQDIVLQDTLILDKSLNFLSADEEEIFALYMGHDGRHIDIAQNGSGAEKITLTFKNVILDGRDDENGSPVGGGISSAVDLVLKGAAIQYCTQQDGGAVLIDIPADGRVSLEISDSKLLANKAASNGGGIAMSNAANGAADLKVENTIFLDNSAVLGRGGGIYFLVNNGDSDSSLENSALEITDTLFKNNAVGGNTSVLAGGGVYIEAKANTKMTGTIKGTIFEENRADGNGGGLMFESKDSRGTVTDFPHRLELENVTFQENSVRSDYSSGGGASFIMEEAGAGLELLVHNSEFTGNIAQNMGGGMYLYGNINAELKDRMLFQKNAAGTSSSSGLYDGGGAIYIVRGVRLKLMAEDENVIAFEENEAPQAGAIFCAAQGREVSLELLAESGGEILFTGNEATRNNASQYGGAIYTKTATAGIDLSLDIKAQSGGTIKFLENFSRFGAGLYDDAGS